MEISVSDFISSVESNTIRMTERYRIVNNIDSDFVYMRNRMSNYELLKIIIIKADEYHNDNYAYVHIDMYRKLFLKNRYNFIAHNGVSLGCDPEAFITDKTNGAVVQANMFLNKRGEVGSDGMLLEFRPAPSFNPREVSNNIQNLIFRARNILNSIQGCQNTNMVAVSSYDGLSAGFHLHYGFPNELLSKNIFSIHDVLVNVLDYFIGITSIVPEGIEDTHRRTSKLVDYGKPGNYRRDNKTFEYRVPGAANLKHPVLTEGLLSLGAVVIRDLISRIYNLTNGFLNLNNVTEDSLCELYPNMLKYDDITNIICNNSIPNKYLINRIKTDIRQMIGFTEFGDRIENYFNAINDKFSNNIEENWLGEK